MSGHRSRTRIAVTRIAVTVHGIPGLQCTVTATRTAFENTIVRFVESPKQLLSVRVKIAVV